jgi:hypothetical protein
MSSTFTTNPASLKNLLEDCHSGKLKLPEFQRGWVWDEDRIKSLIASVSRAFPIGALMMLEYGGDINFKTRRIEGAPEEAEKTIPNALILDGQQRLTSLYQVSLMGEVVETKTIKNKKIKRWFYIDIRKALDVSQNREESIVSVPEDRIVREDFGRKEILDLSTPENEFKNFMYPVTEIFDLLGKWQQGYTTYWHKEGCVEHVEMFYNFKNTILSNILFYQVPVITLAKSTSKEAVCVVFEKVNTGGKPLDAFELVTAMYAATGHNLRDDWFGDPKTGKKGRKQRFDETYRIGSSDGGIISKVANTDFLQAISLFHTRDLRRIAETEGKKGKDLPAVTANRPALLNLPLEAYKQYQEKLEEGFVRAAKFLHTLHIYRVFDLPYQSQLIPLAAILSDIGDAWEHEANRTKLFRWYWNGVFGELYGSAVDTRIAKDFMEVPAWLKGGPEPTTVTETMFRADRLKTMRMRLSAAYKGVNALLMKEGAQDFRSGQRFDETAFFGENVDIHHIFPKKWCQENNYAGNKIFDSIINKTPLSYKTNRIIGGDAPSVYLRKLEQGDVNTPPIEREKLDDHLRSHLIDPDLLRADDFEGFLADRQKRLLAIIEQATGNKIYSGDVSEEGEDIEEMEDEVSVSEN